MIMLSKAMPRRWPEQILNFLLPHRCQCCGVQVGEARALCPNCWGQMQFIAPPYCHCCGLPFPADYGAGAETLCARCLSDPPPFAQARSALAYNDGSKPLVLKFKHGDQLHLAPAMAEWMARAAPDYFVPDAILVPVPLHRWRIFLRRYNQSALLVEALARRTGLPMALDALVRHRRTRSQGGLNREQREKNVTGAFRIKPQWRAAIHGKTIILVDDVFTTGATAAACAQALLRAGAAQVKVLTATRVV